MIETDYSDWEVVEDDQSTPARRTRWPAILLASFVIVLMSLICLAGSVMWLGPRIWGGWEVAETTTALVGPDMEVVVVMLRQPIILERAVLILEDGEEVETVTPTEETVSTIAFFVPLVGGNSIPGEIVVRHRGGDFSYSLARGD